MITLFNHIYEYVKKYNFITSIFQVLVTFLVILVDNVISTTCNKLIPLFDESKNISKHFCKTVFEFTN